MPWIRALLHTVGMVFGGVSPQHEVSILSCLQAAAALDRARSRPVPVNIAKDGYVLIHRMIELALQRQRDANSRIRSYDTVWNN